MQIRIDIKNVEWSFGSKQNDKYSEEEKKAIDVLSNYFCNIDQLIGKESDPVFSMKIEGDVLIINIDEKRIISQTNSN